LSKTVPENEAEKNLVEWMNYESLGGKWIFVKVKIEEGDEHL